MLRPGKANANNAADHITVLTDALAQLPEDLRGRVVVRGDSGAGTHRFVEHLDQLGLGYSVGLAGWPTILDALENVPRQAWKAALDSDGVAREGAQVAELTRYVPLATGRQRWPQSMRVIARRERPHPGAQLRITDRDGWRITVFATNLPGRSADLEVQHRLRARAEDRIRCLKDTGLRNLPLHDFAANQIWLELIALASDLLAWTQHLALTGTQARTWKPKRLRFVYCTSPDDGPERADASGFGCPAAGPGTRSCSPATTGSPPSAPDTQAQPRRPGTRKPRPTRNTPTSTKQRPTARPHPSTSTKTRKIEARWASPWPWADAAPARSGGDVGREVLAGEGGTGGDEIDRCSLEDDPAPVVAGTRAQVDDPVGMRHDRQVVLDDDQRLAGVDEPVEQTEQLLDVGEVQSRGRLVEDVDARLLRHGGGQLEPLPLAAGQRDERLTEGQVVEPDVGQAPQNGLGRGDPRLTGAEELLGRGHRHREHLADVTAAEVVVQHRRGEALSSHSSQVLATPAIIARSV